MNDLGAVPPKVDAQPADEEVAQVDPDEPKEDDEQPAADKKVQTTPETSWKRWESADSEIRTTAKWVVATSTSFAAIVFASGGFLVKGDLGPDYFWQRALAMALGSVVAVGGLSAIVGYVAKSRTPEEPSLDALPKALLARMQKAPWSYFPKHILDLTAFRRRYGIWHDSALEFRQEEARLQKQLSEAEGGQPDPGGDNRQLNYLKTRLDATKDAADDATENARRFAEAQSQLLAQARYLSARGSFVDSGKKLVAGAVAVALGASIYTIAVSFNPDEPKASPESTAELAMLSRASSESGNDLWVAADLENCEQDDGTVPVLLESGNGTSTSPWKVRTLPTETCQIVEFAVIGEAANVVVPDETIKIEYTTTTTAASDGG